MPYVRKSIIVPPSAAFLFKQPEKSPIRKHPKRLTTIVAHGKLPPTPFRATEIKYLPAPPIKLPSPTTNIFFTISAIIKQIIAQIYNNFPSTLA